MYLLTYVHVCIPLILVVSWYKLLSRICCSVVSDDEQMYDDKGRDESDKYQDKGVEDEEGLRKLVDSGDEEEEDEDKKDEEMDEDDESRLKDDKGKGGSGESQMILSWSCLSLICKQIEAIVSF